MTGLVNIVARRRPQALSNNAAMLREKDGRRLAAPLRESKFSTLILYHVRCKIKPRGARGNGLFTGPEGEYCRLCVQYSGDNT